MSERENIIREQNSNRDEEWRKVAKVVAQECIQVLKEQFAVREAYIFGSLRGDSSWHFGSDLDIAVEGLQPGRYIEALTKLYELLPQGMEIDLVPLEKAPSSLAALVKGEIKMPQDKVEALSLEVQNELANLERLVKHNIVSLKRTKREPSEERLMVFGKYVHDFYEGVERIFERIERRLDVSLPIGESWHTFLLKQLEREVEGRRHAVIKHTLALKLHRYLRFRHLFRHTYGYELQWEELCPLVEELSETFGELKEQLKQFLDVMTEAEN